MSERQRVALFVCRCGPNLGAHLDLDGVIEALRAEADLAGVHVHDSICSPQGQEWMAAALKEGDATRAVVVGCSPREHGHTFMKVCRQAGFNPYLLAVANVREQCAWVTPDRAEATEKALKIARAALARARTLVPLEERSIECNCDVLVVGSGVAGLTAARLLAEAGRHVIVVEREAAAGGRVPLLSDLAPALECAPCLVDPLLDEVLHHPNIEVLTCSEVREVVGFSGNFTVTLETRARHVDAAGCYGCGTCHAVCPVEVPREADAGLSKRKAIFIPYAGAVPHVSCIEERDCLHFRDGSCQACVEACPFGNIRLDEKGSVQSRQVGAVILATGAEPPPAGSDLGDAVYTAFALERLLTDSGPTEGKILLRDGSAPKAILLLEGADEQGAARADERTMSLAKYAVLLGHKLPEAEITEVLWGAPSPAFPAPTPGGCHRRLYLSAADEAKLAPEGRGTRFTITRAGLGSGPPETLSLTFDMAVIAPPSVAPASARALAESLRLQTSERGLVAEDQGRLKPWATRVAGVAVAGTARGPADGPKAAAEGAAAAGAVLSALVPGRRLDIDPAHAAVDPTRCGGCRRCLAACSFKAVRFHEEQRTSSVEPALCRGCGTCAAGCPTGAIEIRHGTVDQVRAEIAALLR